jgi:2-oxoglutarate dehydrogenase E1 component
MAHMRDRGETTPADPVAESFRRWGYMQADLDPLGRLLPLPHPELDAHTPGAASRWRGVYCGAIGAEFMHMRAPDRSAWLASRLEADPPAPPDPMRLLARVASAEMFERFLHARYVGTKRYSLEGAAGLVTLLDAVLQAAAGLGVEIALLGMSHRGRLTVMSEVVNVPGPLLFAGFEDTDPRSVLGGGDVKYHVGATGIHRTSDGREVAMHLVSNPSHLEAVDPVVMGRARARQQRLGASGAKRVLPIVVHGDGAFAGQGIAAETLNMADLSGYAVGGTVHLVVNNLIGFTTNPTALHSSRYATDVARRLDIPILHVNGEQPEAVHRAGLLAMEYRDRFGSDVVVDLIGYRRYGHSEVDDPTATQPLLYRAIQQRPPLHRLYADRLGVEAAVLGDLETQVSSRLEQAQREGRAMRQAPVLRQMPAYWDAYRGGRWSASLEVDTAITQERLEAIGRAVSEAPAGFALHPKVARALSQRLDMALGRAPVDWGMAETAAFGSLLWEGHPVRLSGEDSRRGTFNQRHAVLVDQQTEAEHAPLSHLHPDQGRFEAHDSPLSEQSVLGYEYGFSRDYPEALVCWEAQFGDFVNGGQVILDQFVSASEDKWGLVSGLVLMLPHGYEGQGPEHSSARLERFLQLAAEDNMQVCQPTTAAQYFHLLRRQALRRWRKPLVVLTPKGMLRLPAAASPREDLLRGRFHTVLPDEERPEADQVLLATGKLVHELRAERERRQSGRTAIVAIEQLHPFPEADLEAALRAHPAVRSLVWVQEEPANMGALSFVRPRLQRMAGDRPVLVVSRSASASPATGSARAHALEQAAVLRLAFSRSGGTAAPSPPSSAPG